MTTVKDVNLQVTIGFKKWFLDLTKDMEVVLGRAVDAGMDVEDAMACYQQCVAQASKNAVDWSNKPKGEGE